MVLEVTVASPAPGGRGDPPQDARRAAATGTTPLDPRELPRLQFDAMRDGDLAAFAAHVHPDARNREAVDEPLACRAAGPAAFLATGLLLRSVFDDLAWDVHDVAVDRDVVVAHATMTGRQAAAFHRYDATGRVASAFPSAGRPFSVTQTHWWRMLDGLMVEHWANRDDMGLALQLGWVPPGPRFVARMGLALLRARRAEARNGGPVPEGVEVRTRPPGHPGR